MKQMSSLAEIGASPITATAHQPDPLFGPAPVFSNSSRELNKFFKALSDETRRSILLLLEKRDYTVGEIVGHFDLSQPTISRHLSVLKEASLVTDQRQGQHVVYRLADETLAYSVTRFFGEFRQCRRILNAF